MAARRYETKVSLRVLKNISRVSAAREEKFRISARSYNFLLLYKILAIQQKTQVLGSARKYFELIGQK